MMNYYMKSNEFTREKASMKKRIISLITAFTMLFQILSPAIAAVLPDDVIEADLNSYSLFDRVLEENYQYIAASFIEEPALSSKNISQFYNDMEINSQLNPAVGTPLAVPIMVPIAVGDITIFIPVDKEYRSHNRYRYAKQIGDDFVQARYIRSQINGILGRNLIDSDLPEYANEIVQINTLYANAIDFFNSRIRLNDAEKLGLSQDGGVYSKNFIWPELRSINGEEVLVPIVYLSTSTVATRGITDHVVVFNGATSFNQLNIEQVDIQFGREAFLQVAQDLLNNQGSLTATDDFKVIVGGTLTNASGIIQATGDLQIAAHSIASNTIVHRYDIGSSQGTRFGEIATINSTNGDIVLRSYSDISLTGTEVSAGESITLAADGNIYLGSEEIYSSYEGYYDTKSSVEYLQTKLTAEDTIKLIAEGSILIDAAELVSNQGHIELLAALGITLDNDLAQTQSYFKRGDTTSSAYKTVAMRALLDAGKDIRLHTEFGDITLKSADITSLYGTSVTAKNGGVNLLMTTETDHYSYSDVNHGLFTTTVTNYGHEIETGVPNTIVGGFAVEALNGVKVEYEGNPDLSMDEQIAELAKFEGLEWMAEVRANTPDADWTAIETQYNTWNESNTSLSPALMAVIAIVVAVYTGGVGGEFLVNALSQSAATAASSVGITSATTLTAISTAAVTTLASQTTLALANGLVNGDVAQALSDLASEETFKNLAVSMVTAGAIASIDTDFFGIPAETAVFSEVPPLSLGDQIKQSLMHSTARAGISTIAYGGSIDDFGDSLTVGLMQSSINALGKTMAEKIGAAYKIEGEGGISNTVRYLAHAGTGCMIGLLSGSVQGSTDDGVNCASGMGGAVVGEYIGDVVNDLNDFDQKQQDLERLKLWLEGELGEVAYLDPATITEDSAEKALIDSLGKQFQQYDDQQAKIHQLKQEGVDLAKLGAGFAALAAGGNVELAAAAGENAAENNVFWIPAMIRLSFAVYNAIDLYQRLEAVYAKGVEASEYPPGSTQRAQALEELADMVLDEASDFAIDYAAGNALDLILDAVKKTKGATHEMAGEVERLKNNVDQGKVHGASDAIQDTVGTYPFNADGVNVSPLEALTGKNLKYHEGMSKYNPHTIRDHVGKSDPKLKERFDNPKFKGDVNSSYTDIATADKSIADAITLKSDKIAAFLNGSDGKYEFIVEVPQVAGRVATRGVDEVVETRKVWVLLIRDDMEQKAGNKAYVIKNSFPTNLPEFD